MGWQTGESARFWDKVEPEPMSGCWLWAGTQYAGYGYFWFRGAMHRAYQVAYWCFVGAVPTNLTLDHKCRVRSCVNPAHLEPVAHRENILRGEGPTAINARKTHCIRGHLLVRRANGDRRCGACLDAYFIEYRQKNRALLAEKARIRLAVNRERINVAKRAAYHARMQKAVA